MFLTYPKAALAGLATILSIVTSTVSAQQVTLNSVDGTVSMSGELLSFDGETYLLGMAIGEIAIDASQVVCEGDDCPVLVSNLTEFSIVGSSSIGADLMPALIEVFALERGGDLEVTVSGEGNAVYNVLEPDGSVFASISVQSTNTVDGFTNLMAGDATIGMSSRRVSPNEVSAFEISNKGRMSSAAQERILALDGVIIAVHPENPVKILSLEQMTAIFEGQITNWIEVGGNDAPIRLYRRNEASGTTATFSESVMVVGARVFSSNSTILDTDGAVSDAVANDPNGIGITSYAQERNADTVVIRSVCGELFEPSSFSIKTEEYPLTRRMYLYTARGEIPDVAKEFLEFVTSNSAQSIIENAGFIGQNPGRATLDAQGRRLAQAIVSSSGRTELLRLQDLTAIVLDAERLSFTLRYDANGELDSRAMADIERLADMIRNGEFSSRQLLVFGFSDNAGAINSELGATQDVAAAVRDAIVTVTGRANLGNVRISPIGYGRLLPLGCNETLYGRTLNNRVEIWVK